MIDKKLLQLPGIKKILMLLAGSAILQAIFIIRSEEHTSELQSRSDLVCSLLLEKKKKIK